MVTTIATGRDSKTALTRRLIYHYQYRTDFSQQTDSSSSSSSLDCERLGMAEGVCLAFHVLLDSRSLACFASLSVSVSLSVSLSFLILFVRRHLYCQNFELYTDWSNGNFLHTDWRITISFLALLSLRPIGELQFLGTSFLDTHWRIIVSSLFFFLFFLRCIGESEISWHFFLEMDQRITNFFALSTWDRISSSWHLFPETHSRITLSSVFFFFF